MLMNIFFDIDDTLFPSSEFSALARKNALNAMIAIGLDCEYQKLNDLLLSLIKEKGSNYPNHFNDLCKILNANEPAKFVAAAVAAYHHTKSSIAPYPQIPKTLLRLKDDGHHIYVATNGDSVKQWDKLIRLGLALYFDNVFISEEVGVEKSPEFYSKILKSLNVEPSQCVMIGDREDADIVPAKKVGMKTIRILKGKHSHTPSTADFTIEELGNLYQIMQHL